MPYISTEALLGAALLVLVAVGYQYIPKAGDADAGPSTAGKSKSAKKKNKKKTSGGAEGKDGKASDVEVAGQSQVEGIQGKGKARQAEKETEVDQPASKPALARPKTLAEKLAPKQRKTKVDDMLAPEDRAPSYARVMKIIDSSTLTPARGSTPTPAPAPQTEVHEIPAAPVEAGSKPPASPAAKVAKFEDDYASDASVDATPSTATEEDDGWNVVPSGKTKKPVSVSLNISNPSSGPSIPGHSEQLTRMQKKNLKKSEAKKAARAAEEEDRQRRLAMHKRDLEREKINDLYSNTKKTERAKGKALSGGQHATVTSNGKLVWD